MPISNKLLKITKSRQFSEKHATSKFEMNPLVRDIILAEKIRGNIDGHRLRTGIVIHIGELNVTCSRLCLLKDGEERFEDCDKCGRTSVLLVSGVCGKCSE